MILRRPLISLCRIVGVRGGGAKSKGECEHSRDLTDWSRRVGGRGLPWGSESVRQRLKDDVMF